MVCELCGSNEFTKDDDGLFVCDYCRTKYTAEQAKNLMVEGVVQIDRSLDADKLLNLAKSALERTNYREALEYSNKVLEIDPSLSQAWLVKGKSAGSSDSESVTANLKEMLGAFKSAVEFATDEEKRAVQLECGRALNDVSVAVFNRSLQHTLTSVQRADTMNIAASLKKESVTHTPEYLNLNATWPAFVLLCDEILSILDTAFSWSGERNPLDNQVIIASQLITGLKYRAQAGLNPWQVRVVTPESVIHYQKIIDTASAKIREFDPAYVTPTPKSQTQCFVITATMGNEMAQPVVILRSFRDELLQETTLGRKFISWYYVYGPKIAGVIENSVPLRALSFALVVLPATSFAWIALQVRKAQSRN